MANLKLQHHYKEVRESLERYINKHGLENTIKEVQKDVRGGIPDDRRKNATAYGMWWYVERDIRLPINRAWGVDNSHIGSLMEKICKDMGIYDKF